MTREVNDKLLELVQLCGEKQIKISFTQYASKKNSIVETIEMGERVLLIQISDRDDKNLLKLIIDSLTTI